MGDPVRILGAFLKNIPSTNTLCEHFPHTTGTVWSKEMLSWWGGLLFIVLFGVNICKKIAQSFCWLGSHLVKIEKGAF